MNIYIHNNRIIWIITFLLLPAFLQASKVKDKSIKLRNSIEKTVKKHPKKSIAAAIFAALHLEEIINDTIEWRNKGVAIKPITPHDHANQSEIVGFFSTVFCRSWKKVAQFAFDHIPDNKQLNMYDNTTNKYIEVSRDKIVCKYPVLPFNTYTCTFNPSLKTTDIIFTKTDIAQTNDAQRLLDAINAIPEGKRLVLFGQCRGASALITLLANHPEITPKIAGMVLVSPFASLEHLFRNSCSFITHIPLFVWRMLLPRLFIRAGSKLIAPHCKLFHTTPLQALGKIEADIPMLFVYGKHDFGAKDTQKLFNARIAQGATNAKSLALNSEQHILFYDCKNDFASGVLEFYEDNGIIPGKEL